MYFCFLFVITAPWPCTVPVTFPLLILKDSPQEALLVEVGAFPLSVAAPTFIAVFGVSI